MPHNILELKREIALSVKEAADHAKGIELINVAPVGESYPLKPDVPGVWVYGPDAEGRYTVTMSIAVALMNIPAAADRLRAEVWNVLHTKHLDTYVKSVDIRVEDLILAV